MWLRLKKSRSVFSADSGFVLLGKGVGVEGHLSVNHQLSVSTQEWGLEKVSLLDILLALFPLQGEKALMFQHPLAAPYSMPFTAPTAYSRDKYSCCNASATAPLGRPLSR